jgi:hypothetical protein
LSMVPPVVMMSNLEIMDFLEPGNKALRQRHKCKKLLIGAPVYFR